MASKSTLLREMITSPDMLVMPDAFDPLSARIIERIGFKAVQCSGYSFSLAACCQTEAAFGLERNLAITQSIVEAVEVPVMADGEDGFGDPTAVAETVRKYMRVGVAGINLEDQVLGQPGPKQTIKAVEMVAKIKSAREAACKEGAADLVINGRTDALAAAADRKKGMEEAIRRSNLYLEAGADLAFVTAVSTMEEVTTLVREVHGPLSIAAGMPYNIRSLSLEQLKACGVARVSLPVVAVFSAIRAIEQSLKIVQNTSELIQLSNDDRLCSADEIAALLSKNRNLDQSKE